MKFNYKKLTESIVLSDAAPITTHILTLEGSDFKITASRDGVFLTGTTPLFQPEEGECNMPVDEFREFINRISSAFTLAWQEQQKEKRDARARQTILEAP